MAGKDVELRIKARDEASQNVKRIADALKILSSETQDTAKGAGKLGSALGGVSTDLARMQRDMDKLKVAGKVAAEIDKTSNAAARLRTAVQGSAQELARMARETEQASISFNRLKASESALEAQLSSARSKLAAIRQEQRVLNDVVKQATADRDAYNKAVANTAKTPASVSAGVFVRGALTDARAQRSAYNASAANDEKQLREEIARTSNALKELRPQLSAASSLKNKLSADTERVAATLRRERDELAKVRDEQRAIADVASRASSALGGLSVTQDKVAKASQRMAVQIAAAKARIESLGATRVQPIETVTPALGDTTALTNQRRAMLEARREWAAAQAEVKRLAQEIRASTQPTEQMGQALGRAQAAARLAKDQFEQNRLALHRMGGAVQSSFAAFTQGANQLRAAGAATAAANEQIASSAGRATNSQRQLGPAVRQTAGDMANAAARTNSFNGALLGLGNGTRQALSLTQRLRGEILSLTASYLGFFAAGRQIGDSINSFRDLEAIQSRLGAVFQQNTQQINAEISWLKAQADRLGISLGTLGNEYAKFAVAANASNFSQQATRDIFLSVAEAGRVNKLSLDQLRGTLLAIEQIISKGKFTSEEVRRQLGDRLPGAFSILAKSMGLTTAELDKMMSQGELMASEENLLKFADELSRRFGPQLSTSLDTVTTDIGLFENRIFQAQLRIADGFIPALREALKAFNEFSNSNQGRTAFTQIGALAGRLILVLAQIPKYFDLIVFAAQAFIALNLAGTFVSLVTRINQARTAYVGLSAQMAFIGPQAQQMSMAQRILGQSFAMTIGRIDAYRASLMASSAATNSARASTSAMITMLSMVRAGMMATAGVARTLWVAIGGLPGLIATGVVFALGNWLTRIDDATSALVEHERQVDAIKQAYFEAGESVDQWASKIEGVTLAQAERNLSDLTTQYQGRLRELLNLANGIRGVYDRLNNPQAADAVRGSRGQSFITDVEDIIFALDRLEMGMISINEFGAALDAVYRRTSDDEIKGAIQELLEFAAAAGDGTASLQNLERAIKDQIAVIKVVKGENLEAAESSLELAIAVEEANKAFDRAAAIATYTDAIDLLKSKIPGLSAELKHMAEITEINAAAFRAMMAAIQTGDWSKIGEVANLWSQASNAANASFIGGGSFVDRLIQIESSGNPNAKNPLSSATGLGQFIESTWLRMFRQYFPDRAAGLSDAMILEYRKNAEVSRQMVQLYAQENARFLQSAGIAINDANLYLAHFLGPGGAKKLLTAAPGTPTSAVLGRDQISANKSILEGKTVEQVIAWAQEKMGISQQQLAIETTLNDLELDRIKTAEEQALRTQQRIDQLDFQISQQRLLNDGKAREAEIEAAIAEARRENPDITDEEIERIRQQTAALYELKNAREGLNLAEEQVNNLYTLRQQLLEQLKLAEEMGDQGMVVDLKARLEGVNLELENAIQRAIAMWQAIGGPEADAAIAKLQTMSMTIGRASQQMGAFGLSMQQWGGLANSFADGLVGVFDKFAQALANGENAMEALGKAFLQFAADFLREIAKMILKQMILNALQGIFPGLGLTGHTGGLVGSKAIGGGNATRQIAPQWFSTAMRYHTGGIAGLRPDEVPAVLKRNEEVLTEEDPRHRFNMGGDNAQKQSAPSLKQVLVLDPNEVVNALSSKAGEQVTITHIKANRQTIRKMLG